LDQQGSSATLVMPDVVTTMATVVEVQVFRGFLPVLVR
jgi:hypothetical protein